MVKRAKALFDFDAKEANELPFKAGAVIVVKDDRYHLSVHVVVPSERPFLAHAFDWLES